MNDLLAPIVPPEVDLTDYGFMPLDIRRLLRSETWIEAADEPRLGHVLVCLWAESWHQKPAASLPDNDKVLARFAMCDLKTWLEIKPKALAGWIKCSDGLLYHPVVAEKALEAWEGKRNQRERTRAATEARKRQRVERQEAADEDRDVDGDGERGGQRDVDVTKPLRSPREKRGEERRGDAAGPYAFEGKTFRVNQKDLDGWQRSFPSYPDLGAELAVIDAKFSAMDKRPAKPFITAAQWLRAGHERRLKEGPPIVNGVAVDTQADNWRQRVKGFVAGRRWLGEWGPEPLAPNCHVPPPILDEFRDQLETRGRA